MMMRSIGGFVFAAAAFLNGAAAADGGSGPARLDPALFGRLGDGVPQARQSDLDALRRLGVLEPISRYRTGNLRRIADVNGLLEVKTASDERNGCTASAISESLILTNNHCVPRVGPYRPISAIFHHGYEDETLKDDVPRYAVKLPALEQGGAYGLDYAILELLTPIPNFRPLRPVVRDALAGEALTLMGHPHGSPLLLIRQNCASHALRPISGEKINHVCDALPGNSGSLIFSADDYALVGLHHQAQPNFSNQGIRMVSLLAASETLRELLGDRNARQPDAGVAPNNGASSSTSTAVGVASQRWEGGVTVEPSAPDAAPPVTQPGPDGINEIIIMVERDGCAKGLTVLNTRIADTRSALDKAALLHLRGDCHNELGMFGKAETDLRAAYDLNPADPLPLNNLAYRWVERGVRIDEAIMMLQGAVTQEPHNPFIIDSLGFAYLRAGRIREAVELLERAVLSTCLTDPVVTSHLGDAYRAAGRFEDAVHTWLDALSDPLIRLYPELKAENTAKIERGGEPVTRRIVPAGSRKPGRVTPPEC